jgi:hypothetical protein
MMVVPAAAKARILNGAGNGAAEAAPFQGAWTYASNFSYTTLVP